MYDLFTVCKDIENNTASYSDDIYCCWAVCMFVGRQCMTCLRYVRILKITQPVRVTTYTAAGPCACL